MQRVEQEQAINTDSFIKDNSYFKHKDLFDYFTKVKPTYALRLCNQTSRKIHFFLVALYESQ